MWRCVRGRNGTQVKTRFTSGVFSTRYVAKNKVAHDTPRTTPDPLSKTASKSIHNLCSYGGTYIHTHIHTYIHTTRFIVVDKQLATHYIF